jgi:hypothetical protein
MLGLGVMGALHHYGHPASHIASSHQPLPVQTHTRRGTTHSGRRSSDSGASASDHADAVSYHHHGGGSDNPPPVAMLAIGLPAIVYATPVKPLASENELAFGGAARAPGSPRGPPTLS